MSVENDVKEELEQARPKLELEKLTQEKEQEIKKGRKKVYLHYYYYFIHALSYFK